MLCYATIIRIVDIYKMDTFRFTAVIIVSKSFEITPLLTTLANESMNQDPVDSILKEQ